MRVCVYGCGAIGGLLAARLSAAGADLSVIARGETLQVLRADGLRLLAADGSDAITVTPSVSADPAQLGVQDIVFLTMKSHSVPSVAEAIAPLLGSNTIVVTASNGIPWWYFHGVSNESAAPELTTVDPGKKLWHAIGAQRALGCIVYPAASVVRPGVVQHVFGDRFTLGEPCGGDSERLGALSELLQSARFDAPIAADIRAEIWTKLVANAAYNPVSVVTGKTLGGMLEDEASNALLTTIMEEVVAVARAYNVVVPLAPQTLLDATRPLGEHKTSMLQDFEAARPLELEPIVGAVLEMAGMRGVATPNLVTMYQLAAARAAARESRDA